MPNTSTRAREILDALATRYAAMRSYQDQGFVHLHDIPDSTDIEFHTLYSAPNLVRFEFTDSHPYPPLSHIKSHDIVGFDGTTAYSWRQHHNDPPELAMEEDISLAVAGATGVSGGAAHTIFRLLLPQIRGFSILQLKDLDLLNDVDFSGTPCHQLIGYHPNGDRHTLTIERNTLLLRQRRWESSRSISEEVHHHIQVNHPIAPDTFNLPPVP